MNEELKAKLLTYLAHLEGAVKGTGDFVAEQAPLVVQEYVLYMRVSSTLGMLLAGLFFALVFSILRWVSKAPEKDIKGDAGDAAFAFGCIFLSLGILTAAGNISTCIKSYVAPRILVLDYIKEQVK